MRRLVSDTLVIAERNLVRLPRAPDLLLAFTVQPIMFVLLFVYVFGGAISTPGYSYVDFLIPGIIVQNIAFGGFVTALGLNEDLHKGLIDRFRSLPMARAAVLAGRTLADVVTNTLSVDRARDHRADHRLLVQPSAARSSPASAAAAVRLRLLVGLRADRAVGLLARGGESVGFTRSSRSRSSARRSCRSTRCRRCCRGSPRSTRSRSSSTRCAPSGSARRPATHLGRGRLVARDHRDLRAARRARYRRAAGGR